MTIKKFQGKTKEEAIEKAKQEFGASAVVMNVKEIKPRGFLSSLKSSTFEVTAAMEEKERFTNTVQKEKNTFKPIDNINFAADEEIGLPPITPVKREDAMSNVKENDARANSLYRNSEEIEKRLENLSNILERRFSTPETSIALVSKKEEVAEEKAPNSEAMKFAKILYTTMLNNEVNEKYVNQILEEAEKATYAGTSVDYMLSNVYQKMILKLGQPKGIELSVKKPKVVFFIGPTGVGKTTTIAKIASKFKVEQDKKVAFLTADTYRIAAAEQLRIYANILDAPISVIYSAEELNTAVENVKDADLIFVDTAGFSHKNQMQREDVTKLIAGLDEKYEKEVFLVLSATTKYKDLLEIVDIYHEIADYKLIFTKLDETSAYGNILNIRLYSGADLSYIAMGQDVPNDLELFNSQKIVKQLLGGK